MFSFFRRNKVKEEIAIMYAVKAHMELQAALIQADLLFRANETMLEYRKKKTKEKQND